MNLIDGAGAASRLQRLAHYLESDPTNAALLADACDAAVGCGQHAQAEAFIATGERHAPGAAWQLRRAHLCMATGELARARSLLVALRDECGAHPVLVHDLACVLLLQGDAAQARRVLAADAGDGFAQAGPLRDALQALWLRALHRVDALEEAWEGIGRWRDEGQLGSDAAAVASLIALDLDDPEAANALAQEALAAGSAQTEALVTRGFLALAGKEAGEAARCFHQVLARQAGDGRASWGLGCALLLAGDVPAACHALQRAVEAMPRHAESRLVLACAQWLLQDAAGARANLRQVIDAQPASEAAEAARALQQAWGDGTRPRAAVEAAMRALLAQWSPRA